MWGEESQVSGVGSTVVLGLKTRFLELKGKNGPRNFIKLLQHLTTSALPHLSRLTSSFPISLTLTHVPLISMAKKSFMGVISPSPAKDDHRQPLPLTEKLHDSR